MSFSNEKPLLEQDKVWKSQSLRKVVLEAIKDTRFVGLSQYMANLELRWSRQIPTACAGHGFIFFNPDFFDKIPTESRKSVIAHEVWHLILRHIDRMEGLNPVIYNQASDHVINIKLDKEGFTFEGVDPLMDYKYDGKNSEEIYNIIYKDHRDNDTPMDLSKHVSNEQIKDLIEEAIKDDPNNSIEKQIKKAEEDIKDNEALINSSGNSNNYTTMLLEITNKKELIIGATYEEIFSKYLVDPLTGGKRTFLRPNRRQHGNKSSLKIPGRSQRKGTKNRLKHLTYALDVSGSISHKQATQFHQSVWTIKELLNPTKLTVLFFNTQIVLEKTFSDVEPYTTIEVRGSGGTCLRDVYAKTRQLDSEALVIFTDMQVQIPPEPDWDTIWLVPDKRARIKPDLYGEIYLIPDHKQ